MDSGLIRCTNCLEELPEEEFNAYEFGQVVTICDQCLDEMGEDDENELTEESEDDFQD